MTVQPIPEELADDISLGNLPDWLPLYHPTNQELCIDLTKDTETNYQTLITWSYDVRARN
jgi:cell wall assembly regulator SMI1